MTDRSRRTEITLTVNGVPRDGAGAGPAAAVATSCATTCG